MSIIADLKSLDKQARNAIVASYLGWTLDAFDFFILVFVLKDVAATFGTTIKSVTLAITLTLAFRPLGALIFGQLADRLGRRPALMINILIYSVVECLSGFAPSLTAFIVLRAIYGIAMGGEWGVGASLVLESVPVRLRGLVSGILQAGYPSGYFLASLIFFSLFPYIGWRGMFIIGVLPALLVFYVRRHVDESPAFITQAKQTKRAGLLTVLKTHFATFIWAVLMMAGFNFLSHGTQDIYPTFLQQQRHLDTHQVGSIALVYNFGAMLGGLFFGILSEKIGRKRAIALAAFLVLPVIPFWVSAQTVYGLAASAFLIQFFAQGAWGVVPVHLNEISPQEIRGTFPGFAYQLGNLLAAYNATLQAGFAEHHNGAYGEALALVAAAAAVAVVVLSLWGYEARGRIFGATDDAPLKRGGN